MTKLQLCIIKELETCEESTPANLVEAAFKFIRNETPCVNFTVSFIFAKFLNNFFFNKKFSFPVDITICFKAYE